MNEIKILELNLRNFKGIKDFKLVADGKNVDIYGDNATGKTTIMDAFLWILFDKDSANSSNFNIKTLDDKGNVIHGLEHEVTARLEIDGKEVELQKIYKEKWTKKRGQAESELTGHTTEYFINAVPKKKSEYQDYLSNIIHEETFKILTNPLYFNTSLKWQERRNMALNICGEVEDQEVIAENEDLKELMLLLEDKSIEDLKAEMAARRRKLNEELKSIPYRIDEVSRDDVIVDVEKLTKNREEIHGKLSDLKNPKDVDYDFRIRDVNGSIRVLENQMKELEQNLTKEIRENIDTAMESLSNIKKNFFEAKDQVEDLKRKIKITETEKETIEKRIEELRVRFKEASNQVFDENSTICPTCKQSLPVDETENHRAEFESNKQQALQEINNDGKIKKAELEELVSKLKDYEIGGNETHDEAEMLETMMKDKQSEIDNLEQQLRSINITETLEYKELQSKINHLHLQRQELEKLAKEQDNTVEIKDLESQISDINKELAKVDLAKEDESRVKDLKDRERELAQMVADTEKIEFLCDQYVITKSNLLEDKLNSKFDLVKFKLFEKQVNGGINETFVTTVNGVPFEDLNNAMKIVAGLDIINTLTDYYNFKAPIFIDNRESVNEIVDVKSQVINLRVSKHKNLRVEVEERC